MKPFLATLLLTAIFTASSALASPGGEVPLETARPPATDLVSNGTETVIPVATAENLRNSGTDLSTLTP
jgi:hypothetical protein